MTDNWKQIRPPTRRKQHFFLSVGTAAKTVLSPGWEGMVYDEVGGTGPPEVLKTELRGSLGCSLHWNSEDGDISVLSPGSKLRKLLEHPTPPRPPSIDQCSGLSSR